MYNTEKEYIEQMFFDNGSLRPGVAWLTKLEYVAHRHKRKEGGLFLICGNKEIASVADNMGNYAYIRYKDDDGNHAAQSERNKYRTAVQLTFVASLPDVGDPIKAGIMLMNFVGLAVNPDLGTRLTSTLRSNIQRNFMEETGLTEDKVRKSMPIIAFDFEVSYPRPKDCEITDFSPERC